MSRRPLVVLVVLVAVTSGCAGVLAGEDLTFTASPISVSNETVAQTDFELRESRTATFDRTIDLQGESRTVTITSHFLIFRAAYRDAPLGHLVIVSTPKAGVLGQGLNPLGLVGVETLVSQIMSQTSDTEVEGLNQTTNRSARILGANRTVSFYAAQSANREIQIALVRFTHEDDYIIGIGVYPATIETGPRDALSIFKTIQHNT